MKLQALGAILLAILPAALAVDQWKNAIVWFQDENTSDKSYQDVKKYVLRNGGIITHEFIIIRGFSVNLPAKTLEGVSAMSEEHGLSIEEDEVMTTN